MDDDLSIQIFGQTQLTGIVFYILMALNVHVMCPVFSECVLNVYFHVFPGCLLHVCTFLLLFWQKTILLSGLIDSFKPVTQSLSTQSPSQWQSIDSVTSQLTWIANPFDSVYFFSEK